jgi:hypothetical protein
VLFPSDSPLKVSKKKRVLITTAISTWVIAIGFFMAQMMAFDVTPRTKAAAPQDWPVQSSITRVWAKAAVDVLPSGMQLTVHREFGTTQKTRDAYKDGGFGEKHDPHM